MYSIEEEYKIARALTGSSASDIQITLERTKLTEQEKELAVCAISKIRKYRDKSFNKVFPFSKEDFKNAASEFLIDPATLFCIYMDYEYGNKNS